MSEELLDRLRIVARQELPLPGNGHTPERHRMLFDIGVESLSLARLAEAHFDAIAILAEADRRPEPAAIYGVWASETPNQSLLLSEKTISGTKMFCSGAGLIDRALTTVGESLIDLDLRSRGESIRFDYSSWKTDAFKSTNTATVLFEFCDITANDIVGRGNWYLERSGFWHGALGPAACWGGGAHGLVEYALRQTRNDPHTYAHLGAITSSTWANLAYLDCAGREADEAPMNVLAACIRARSVRHLIEQSCSDILVRLMRAYGPRPLAMDESISLRIRELELYLRQCHGERDLEVLGLDVKPPS